MWLLWGRAATQGRPYKHSHNVECTNVMCFDLGAWWLPEYHLAWFVSDGVDRLDLSAIFQVYGQGDGRGPPVSTLSLFPCPADYRCPLPL